MKLPWGQADSSRTRRRPGAAEAAPEAQACPSLAKVLERILKQDDARILDLGPFCGDSAVFLAGRGARVNVEEFVSPPPPPPADPDRPGEEAPPVPLTIHQDDRAFHLVLAWEQIDFIPPERLSDFGAELRRVLAPGGFALLFARNTPAGEERIWRHPGRYRVVDDDRIIREDSGIRARRRWVHPTRDIERALAPLTIEGLHLQRNQLREFMVKRKPS